MPSRCITCSPGGDRAEHCAPPTLTLPGRRGRGLLPPLRSGGGLGWGPKIRELWLRSRAAVRDYPRRDLPNNLMLDPVVSVIGERLARITNAASAFEGEQLLHRHGVKLLHQAADIAKRADLAVVEFVVHHQDRNAQLVERHGRYGATARIAQDARRQDQPVGTVSSVERGRNESGRLRTATCPDQ